MPILIAITIILTVYTCKFSNDFEKEDLQKVGAFLACLILIVVVLIAIGG